MDNNDQSNLYIKEYNLSTLYLLKNLIYAHVIISLDGI